ncbi:hypothetical protein COBT_002171, partial [Conglomerata obtusa]
MYIRFSCWRMLNELRCASNIKKAVDIDEIGKSIEELKKAINCIKDKTTIPEESKNLLILKIDVALNEYDSIKMALEGDDCSMPIVEQNRTNIFCGCKMPNCFGGWGPIEVSINYYGCKARKQEIGEKIAALDIYLREIEYVKDKKLAEAKDDTETTKPN